MMRTAADPGLRRDGQCDSAPTLTSPSLNPFPSSLIPSVLFVLLLLRPSFPRPSRLALLASVFCRVWHRLPLLTHPAPRVVPTWAWLAIPKHHSRLHRARLFVVLILPPRSGLLRIFTSCTWRISFAFFFLLRLLLAFVLLLLFLLIRLCVSPTAVLRQREVRRVLPNGLTFGLSSLRVTFATLQFLALSSGDTLSFFSLIWPLCCDTFRELGLCLIGGVPVVFFWFEKGSTTPIPIIGSRLFLLQAQPSLPSVQRVSLFPF